MVWHTKFTITYVDGEVIEATSAEWGSIRADGVERINFHNVQRSGDSIYYLYPEVINNEGEVAWVCGSFAVYQNTCEEQIMRLNGECFNRTRRSVPDLKHSQVKLGWWRIVDDD